MDTAVNPEPPEVEEPEPEEEEPEEEPPPPEMAQETEPLDLNQLEMALNPGSGDGWSTTGLQMDLSSILENKQAMQGLLGGGAADQPPRVRSQNQLSLSRKLQKRLAKASADVQVTVIFVVDTKGRARNARVEKSNDPAFNSTALAAVKGWRFDPAKRDGKPIDYPTRRTLSFPKG